MRRFSFRLLDGLRAKRGQLELSARRHSPFEFTNRSDSRNLSIPDSRDYSGIKNSLYWFVDSAVLLTMNGFSSMESARSYLSHYSSKGYIGHRRFHCPSSLRCCTSIGIVLNGWRFWEEFDCFKNPETTKRIAFLDSVRVTGARGGIKSNDLENIYLFLQNFQFSR